MSSSTKKVYTTERNRSIDVKLYVTELCPQCAIAINRIENIALENKAVDLNIINVTRGSSESKPHELLAITPYYLIEEKYVVPGTSSEQYIKSVLSTAIETL